jgi:hypothetical protein
MTTVLERPEPETAVFCRSCSRPLHNPESRKRGLGPVCLAFERRVILTLARPVAQEREASR